MKGSSAKIILKKILRGGVKSQKDLDSLKRKAAKALKGRVLSNADLILAYRKLRGAGEIRESESLERLLRIRKIRTLSGIAVVSVLTKPFPCPGNCLYCPTQKGIPKSYLDNEPAVMRAVLNKFDPYLQTKTRLQSLRNIGHPTDKIELIVIGGTWSFLPKNYQTWFIKRCFDACNKKESKNLERAQRLNEKTKNRIIGITLETRPDFITETEIKRMRKLGATRVEIGVQSLYNDILKINRRGHKIDAVIKATKLLKDAGLKVCYHMMPNLPGANISRDKEMFLELWRFPDFRPDLLKIYPCALLKESPLYNLWLKKKYKPYGEKQLINLLKEIKKDIPYYCRIQRLVRDIPSPSIVAGPTKISNLRQILAKEAREEGWQCKCIRCREVREKSNPKERLFLSREDYTASEGKEIFLSLESKRRDKLYSLLRLRLPSQAFERQRHFISALRDSAIIREVHTYGELVPISRKQKIAAQHKSLGKKLIKEAEKIAKEEFGLNKIAVISGIGAKNYYRKLGYKLNGGYMVKILD